MLDSDTYNTYNYIDSYRFGTGIGKRAGTINLANYNIDLKLVDPNYKALSKMWMQVGDQSMEGKPSKGGRAFRFNLGAKDEVADYLGSKNITAETHPPGHSYFSNTRRSQQTKITLRKTT